MYFPNIIQNQPRIWFEIHQKKSNEFLSSDLQLNLSHAHAQRTEAFHLSHMSERFLPEFRPQEACEEAALRSNRIQSTAAPSGSSGSRTSRDDE